MQRYRLVRSSHSEVFLIKGVLKICSKFTREHPCRSVISIKLQSNFTEITLRHGCSPVSLLCIFRTPFFESTSRELKGCFWLKNILLLNLLKHSVEDFLRIRGETRLPIIDVLYGLRYSRMDQVKFVEDSL